MDENKKKIAKLVTIEYTARVVVNANEMPEVEEEDILNAAMTKIKANIVNDLCWDNVTEIEDDNECPYGTFKDDIDTTLRCQLFGLYQKCADWLKDENCKNSSELSIINEGADILVDNLEALEPFDSIFEILTQCVYYINRDFDHEVTLEEYSVMGGNLVEELCGFLGEFFDD